MAQGKKLLVDDELYVNKATLEALRNEIESGVRRSLLWTVMAPLLVAGVALILFGVFWLIPREVGTLLREDPLVNQRFRDATAQYLADPAGGEKSIREQIIAVVRAEEGIRKTVDEAARAAVSDLNVDELVREQVNDVLKEQPLADQIAEFLQSEKGQTLLTRATREYFDSAAGKRRLDAVTSKELRSAEFRTILVDELGRALSR